MLFDLRSRRFSCAASSPHTEGTMTMDRADLTAEAAEYLRIGIELVTADNPLSNEEVETLPGWWPQLADLDTAQSTELILRQWNAALPDVLPRFGTYLVVHGHSSLSRIDADSYQGIAILYVFTPPDEDPIDLVGYPPTTNPPWLPHYPTRSRRSMPRFMTACSTRWRANPQDCINHVASMTSSPWSEIASSDTSQTHRQNHL